jgi:hypothetical protein
VALFTADDPLPGGGPGSLSGVEPLCFEGRFKLGPTGSRNVDGFKLELLLVAGPSKLGGPLAFNLPAALSPLTPLVLVPPLDPTLELGLEKPAAAVTAATADAKVFWGVLDITYATFP